MESNQLQITNPDKKDGAAGVGDEQVDLNQKEKPTDLKDAQDLVQKISAVIGFEGENVWFLRPDLVQNNLEAAALGIDQIKKLVSQHGIELFADNVSAIDGMLLILRYEKVGDIQLAKSLLAERKTKFPNEPLPLGIQLIDNQDTNTQAERIKVLMARIEQQSGDAFGEWLEFTKSSLNEMLIADILNEGDGAVDQKISLIQIIKQYDDRLGLDCYQPYKIRESGTKMAALEKAISTIVENFFINIQSGVDQSPLGNLVVATTDKGYEQAQKTHRYHGQIRTVDGNKIGAWNQRLRAEAMLGVDALGSEDDQLTAYGVMSLGAKSHDVHTEAGYGQKLMHLGADQVLSHTVFTTEDSGSFFQRRATQNKSRFGVEQKNIWQLDWQHASKARLIMDKIHEIFPSVANTNDQDYIEAQILGGFDLMDSQK